MFWEKELFSALKRGRFNRRFAFGKVAKFGLITGGVGTTAYFISNNAIFADGEIKKENQGLTYGQKVGIFTLCISTFVGFNIVTFPFFISSFAKFGKIPFVTTHKARVNTIFELLPQQKILKIGDKPTLVDLGSGDGRIVIEAAKKGYNAVGYEINPWLVLYSRHLAKKQGVSDSCKFVLGDFWEADLSQTSVVTIYGLDTVMDRLKAKIEEEMPVGGFVVSNSFRVPRWKPLDMKQDLYLYVKKDKANIGVQHQNEQNVE